MGEVAAYAANPEGVPCLTSARPGSTRRVAMPGERNRYINREPGSTIYVAFCRENGPCDHSRHTEWSEATECARALSASTGHFHAVKEASRLSGKVFDARPMYPSKTADGALGRLFHHPLTPGEPCR